MRSSDCRCCVVHREDDVGPLEHALVHADQRVVFVPADRTSRSSRLQKTRSAVALRQRFKRQTKSTRRAGEECGIGNSSNLSKNLERISLGSTHCATLIVKAS